MTGWDDTATMEQLSEDRTDDSLIGAERSTIGAMLLDGRVVEDVKALVKPSDFLDPRLEAICETIFEQHQREKPVDVISVGTRMRTKGKFSGSFGEVLLHELVGEVPTARNADHYASIVAGGSSRRRMRQAGLKLISAADDPSIDMLHAIEDGRELLDDAMPRTLEQLPVGAYLDEFFAALQEEQTFIRTPWPDLDSIIDGWKPGRLVVIGARPATGKTVVGVQIGAVAAQFGDAIYFSAEMSRHEVMVRLFSMLGGVRLKGLETGKLSPEENVRLEQTRALVSRLGFHVDDRATTWDEIEAAAWDLARKGNLKLIVVDYLSLYRDGGQHENTRVDVNAMSRRAKILSQRLGITVVLLQQLNRGADKRGDNMPPSMTDLKDTGNLEQDADVVILLHQGTQRNRVNKQLERDGSLHQIVVKQRNGPTGSIETEFQGPYARAVHKMHSR